MPACTSMDVAVPRRGCHGKAPLVEWEGEVDVGIPPIPLFSPSCTMTPIWRSVSCRQSADVVDAAVRDPRHLGSSYVSLGLQN